MAAVLPGSRSVSSLDSADTAIVTAETPEPLPLVLGANPNPALLTAEDLPPHGPRKGATAAQFSLF